METQLYKLFRELDYFFQSDEPSLRAIEDRVNAIYNILLKNNLLKLEADDDISE